MSFNSDRGQQRSAGPQDPHDQHMGPAAISHHHRHHHQPSTPTTIRRRHTNRPPNQSTMRASLLLGSGLLMAAAASAASDASITNNPLLRRRPPVQQPAGRAMQWGGGAEEAEEEEEHLVNIPRTAPATLGDDAGRPAWVYYPSKYDQQDDQTRWPLVLMIHGGGSDSYYHDRLLGVSARVDSHGFVALLPNGTVNSHGLRFWNGIRCCDFDHNGVDDVAYLTGLLAEAKQKLRIDPKRVYIIGHSNGGAMTNILACNHSELVTAVATVAPGEIPDPCTPSHPISMLEVCTSEDTIVHLDLCSAIVGNYSAINGCPAKPAFTYTRDYDCDPHKPVEDNTGFNEWHDANCHIPGRETKVSGWECEHGTSVQFWWMRGARHTPSLNPRWSDDVLTWLLAQPWVDAP